MHLVRKGLVNTRGLAPRWTKPNLFGHYRHLTGKFSNGKHAANYYQRPMSSFVSLASYNRNNFPQLYTVQPPFVAPSKSGTVKLSVSRSILRMKRKGKMANIYKSNTDKTDHDFFDL